MGDIFINMLACRQNAIYLRYLFAKVASQQNRNKAKMRLLF